MLHRQLIVLASVPKKYMQAWVYVCRAFVGSLNKKKWCPLLHIIIVINSKNAYTILSKPKNEHLCFSNCSEINNLRLCVILFSCLEISKQNST